MARPALTHQLPLSDFHRFYWLKEELAAFCRAQGLPASGSKPELTRRIAAYLATGKAPLAMKGRPAASRSMPAELSASTVIGPGWRCSQDLRAFFEREIGPRFHFDALMRDLIHHSCGQSLREVIAAWEAARHLPVAEKTIGPQFEYNQHIRDYFRAHPGASLSQAIQAWKEKRQNGSPRPEEDL